MISHVKAAPRAIVTRPRPRSIWQHLFAFAALRRQRLDLSKLDAHLLEDVGLTATEAQKEADRPVWDVPQTWLK